MRPVSVSIDAIPIPYNQLPPPKNAGYLNVCVVYYIFVWIQPVLKSSMK